MQGDVQGHDRQGAAPAAWRRVAPAAALVALALAGGLGDVLTGVLPQAAAQGGQAEPAATRSAVAVASAELVRAAETGDLVRLRRLLDAGAPVNGRDSHGRTALLAATHKDKVDAARLLIERGADVNLKDELQDSAFLYAGAEGRLAILRLTLAAGADLTSVNRYGGTALIPAAHHGHVETVRELLKTRIALDHVNRLGWTALLEAIVLGDGGPAHTEIVRLLVAAGADVNLPDQKGVSSLAHSQQRGQQRIAEILAQAGARVR
ncbi:MAG: hypothetical protein RIQ60_2892 [Pseudomonadota bacterium]|jgi:ankyrin repeat protein